MQTTIQVFYDGPYEPHHGSEEAAGYDLRAWLPNPDEPIHIKRGSTRCIPTGLKFILPVGTVGFINPKSGLAKKKGISIVNAPGTLDSDFRGEVEIIIETLYQDLVIEHGMKIAQLVVVPHYYVDWKKETIKGSETKRGSNGFGSTGVY